MGKGRHLEKAGAARNVTGMGDGKRTSEIRLTLYVLSVSLFTSSGSLDIFVFLCSPNFHYQNQPVSYYSLEKEKNVTKRADHRWDTPVYENEERYLDPTKTKT